MPESRDARRRLRSLFLIALIAACWTGPAAAQYIGGNAPPLPAAPPPGTIESPAATLSRSVRVLAANPRDFGALITAGRAELDLGDLEAAVGFFGRADEIRPNDPAPKVGMGAATIQTGDARGALQWFDQAQRLGASPALLGADRGLAHDLLGELSAAQSDYRAALSGPSANEARRRMALSQAMSGDVDEALRTLSPLVVRNDPAAMRTRAFVLALSGQQAMASRAIDQAMPGSAGRIAPFFALLPKLSIQQKAAAVHLGVFPSPGEMQLAAAAPPVAPVAAATSRPDRRSRERKPKDTTSTGRRIPIVSPPAPAQVVAAPPVNRPVQANPTVIAATPAVSPPRQLAAAPPPSIPVAQPLTRDAIVNAIASPSPAESPRIVTLDRLSGIDRILAQADAPPAPRPKTETGKPAIDRKAAERKAAADKKVLADKKAVADKLAADRKAKQEADAIGVAGTHWVQLAGGRNEERMASEFKRLRARTGSPLKGRSAFVSQGKDYYRLLVGPFDDAGEARDFVNKLAKAKVDGFSWTRTPAQIKIEKLKL